MHYPCHKQNLNAVTTLHYTIHSSFKLDLDLPSEIKDWEIYHNDLTVEKLLASGQFGRVFLSLLSANVQSQRARKYIETMRLVEGCRIPQMVAVKQLKGQLN